MKYLIVDDEPIAHRIIEGYCKELKQMQKVGNCYNALEAFEVINKTKVELLFLDINMPQLSGFEFLKSLTHPPLVIVTSAYQEYALEGYELNVCDYLLKPFSLERFLKAVNKAMKMNVTEKPAMESAAEEYIFLKGDKKLIRSNLADILFIEAYGNYCKVHLHDQMIITHQKISDFEQQLPEEFIRTHKSYIASIRQIQSIEGNLLQVKDHKIPIGQTFRSRVMVALGLK